MQYLCLIYSNETTEAGQSPEEQKAVFDAYRAFTKEAEDAGVWVGGDALKPTATATTVRIRDGKRLTTDGPFAETKEQLGGYYILDCADLDEAIEYAAKIPSAKHGSIEVRPVMVFG